MQFYIYGDNGNYIESVIGKIPPKNAIQIPPNPGLFCPHWNGKDWEEGASLEEIEEVQKGMNSFYLGELVENIESQSPAVSLEERIANLEWMLMEEGKDE